MAETNDLRTIFLKLGHSIEEIRVRAFNNLTSKIQNEIVSVSDISKERSLLIRLLEWFNYPNPPLKEDVLQLLLHLSKYSSAKSMLINIGAVQFLEKLKNWSSAGEQNLIDRLIEHFTDCSVSAESDKSAECLLYTPINKGLDRNADNVFTSNQPSTLLESSSDDVSVYVLKHGYFDDGPQQVKLKKLVVSTPADLKADCFKFCFYPWLCLTESDVKVLISSISSLSSNDSNLIIHSCKFLLDVVLHDFPAEIFLQRPDTINILFELLSSPSVSPDELIHILHFFDRLSLLLVSRINFYSDSSFFTSKNDVSVLSSQVMSPITLSTSQSVIDGDFNNDSLRDFHQRYCGDGQDGENLLSQNDSLYIGNNETNIYKEDSMLLLQQLSLPQFACVLSNHCARLLFSKGCDHECTVLAIKILHNVITIISLSICSTVWTDPSPPAKEVSGGLMSTFNTLCELIYCLLPSDVKDRNGSSENHPVDKNVDQMYSRTLYLSLASIISNLLTAVVPVDQMRSLVFTNASINVLHDIMVDESIRLFIPEIHSKIVEYISYLEPNLYSCYDTSELICNSIKSASLFLRCSRSDDKNEELYRSWINLVDESIFSFPYYSCCDIVTSYVNCYSIICERSSVDPQLISDGSNVLLKLLSHSSVEIRISCFEKSFSILKDALSVDQAGNISKSKSIKINFILHTDIINEICMYGLFDENSKVKQYSRDILLLLLQSQLLMTEVLWFKWMLIINKTLPYIQMHADIQTHLGQAIFNLTDPKSSIDDHRGSISQLEKFKGNLRFLFHSDIKIRSEVLHRLLWYLNEDVDCKYKRPSIRSLTNVKNLTELLILKNPAIIKRCHSQVISQSRVNNFIGIVDIISNDNVDLDVKKSAFKQVVYHLEDCGLHSVFYENDGKNILLRSLQKGIRNRSDPVDEDNEKELLHCSLDILQTLIVNDTSFRQDLSNDKDFLTTLLAVALASFTDTFDRSSCVVIFFLLLFQPDQNFTLADADDEICFAVPDVIHKRYRVPLKVSTKDEVSPNRFPVCSAIDDKNNLKFSNLHSKLRIAWNFAWFGNVKELLDAYTSTSDDLPDRCRFPENFRLESTDLELIRWTDRSSAIICSVHKIMNAVSHKSADLALWTFMLQILISSVSQDVETIAKLLKRSDWKNAFNRFLRVNPSSASDEKFLTKILSILSMVLCKVPNCGVADYICDVICQECGPLRNAILKKIVVDTDRSSSVYNQIILLITDVVHLCSVRKLEKLKPGELVYHLIETINVNSGSSHFYNLSSLEALLSCLVHITATTNWSRSCSSVQPLSLCKTLVKVLMEVIAAFHVGRGGITQSYMGDGITKCATICLRHIMDEMMKLNSPKQWLETWLYSQEAGEQTEIIGLTWLVPLWTYRDPEVRAAGLGIAVQLSLMPEGCHLIVSQMYHISGGIWGAALSFLVDHTEASAVREQAALLLCNLVGYLFISDRNDVDEKKRSSLDCLANAREKIAPDSIANKEALMNLILHSGLFSEVSFMVENFYPSPVVKTVDISTLSDMSMSSNDNDHFRNEKIYHVNQGLGFRTNDRTVNPLSDYSPTDGMFPPNEGNFSSTNDSRQNYIGGLVTCSLITSTCAMLRNVLLLSKSEIVNFIIDEKIIRSLIRCVNLSLTTKNEAKDVELKMYRSVVRLLQTCASMEDICSGRMIDVGVETWFGLIENIHDVEVLSDVFLLLLLIVPSSPIALPFTILSKWQIVNGAACLCLDAEDKNVSLNVVQFITSILTKENQRVGSRRESSAMVAQPSVINNVDDSILDLDNSDDRCMSDETIPIGLCKRIIKLYVEFVTSKQTTKETVTDKSIIISCLQSLFLYSTRAKSNAVREGFISDIVNNIESVHADFLLDEGQRAKKRINKQDNPHIQEICLNLDLLNNLIFKYDEAKKICDEKFKICHTLHALWDSAAFNRQLLISVLSFIATYCSNFTKGIRSFALTSSVSRPKLTLSSNSLVHGILRMAEKEMKHVDLVKNTTIFKLIFQVLSSFCLVAETRSIVCKSFFLENISVLYARLKKNIPTRKLIESLWLDLLVVLSTFSDGQLTIANSSENIDTLLSLIDSSAGNNRTLYVIRNVCFHPNNKTRLLNNGKILPLLVGSLSSSDKITVHLSLSAIWTLISNNQKAKQNLRSTNVLPKQTELMNRFKNDENIRETIKILYNIIFNRE